MEIFHVLVIMTLAKRVKLQSLKSAVSVDQVYNPPPPSKFQSLLFGEHVFFFLELWQNRAWLYTAVWHSEEPFQFTYFQILLGCTCISGGSVGGSNF